MLALPAPMRVTVLLTALTVAGCPAWAQSATPEQTKVAAPKPAKAASAQAPSVKSPGKRVKQQPATPETQDVAAGQQEAASASGHKQKTATKTVTRAPRSTSVPKTSAVSSTLVDQAVGGEGVKKLVSQYAQLHGVPETLAHRIVLRESRYNPAVGARGHFGLMQISLPTARQMGYTGAPQGLYDARTNLAHGMPYLANAWIVSGGSEARAVSLYSRGYYYDAKRKGLLKSLRTARSAPSEPVEGEAVAVAQ